MRNFLKINLFLILILTILSAQEVLADGGDRMKGYAWSDGIGWISFNCYNDNSCLTSHYGVNVKQETPTILDIEDLEGFAWSDAVGWVSFDYCHSSGDCIGPTFNETNGRIYGDAMVLSGLMDDGDGWDGIIKLSDFGDSSPYGPELQANDELEGYSWGSEVIGWVSYNCVNDSSCATSDYDVFLDDFSFNFTADKGLTENSKAPYESNVLLSWQTIGSVTSCIPTEGTTAWQNHSAGIGQPSDSTFLVSSIEVDTDFTLTCIGGSGSVRRDLHIYVMSPTPIVILGADDTNIEYNTVANLDWSTNNVDSCIISGPVNFTPPQSVPIGINQSASTGNLTNFENFYTISCIPSDQDDYPPGPPYNPVEASILINVEKLIVYFYAEANPVPYNDRFELVWIIEFANHCGANTLTSPQLYGDGGGLHSNFEGTPNFNEGEHIFLSNMQIVEGETYTVRLACTGSNDQAFEKSINLRVMKNPTFIEN